MNKTFEKILNVFPIENAFSRQIIRPRYFNIEWEELERRKIHAEFVS